MQRLPVFYGWIVAIMATVGLMATSPGQSYSVSLFFDFFIEDFGLTRTAVSGLYGAGTFIASLSLIWIGRQIDTRGNRLVMVVIGVLFAGALFYMSTVSGALMLLVGFIAIRALGQGSLSLVSSTVIANWFESKRGRVMGLAMVAYALFQAAYVPGLQRLLENLDWRIVWQLLGLGVLLLFVPLAWVLIRNRPAEHGLQVDGNTADETDIAQDTGKIKRKRKQWTLSEAMRTPMLWVFTAGRLLVGSFVTALVIHQVSIFEQVGHIGRTAANTYALITLIAAGSTLAFGWILDRFSPGRVMAFQLACLLGALLLSDLMTTLPLVYGYGLLIGLVMGAGGVFDGVVWPNIYGTQHQGAIRGFSTTAMVIGTSTGPVIFGFSFDQFGSYAPALYLCAALCGVVAVAALVVPQPEA
jgi:sugar phosphate permease